MTPWFFQALVESALAIGFIVLLLCIMVLSGYITDRVKKRSRRFTYRKPE